MNENHATAGWHLEPGTSAVLRYWNITKWEEWRQRLVATPSVPAPSDGVAVTALIFSLVGVALDLTILLGVVGFAFSLAGLICGRIGAKRSTRLKRRRMALWAFWLGLVPLVVQVLVLVLLIVFRMPLARNL